MKTNPKTKEEVIEEKIEKFYKRYECAWITEKGRHNHIRWILKSWLRKALQEAHESGKREERDRIWKMVSWYGEVDGTEGTDDYTDTVRDIYKALNDKE